MNNTINLRVASANLNQTIANFTQNVPNILAAIDKAAEDGADVLALQELGLTGYSGDDYFKWIRSESQQKELLELAQYIADYAAQKNPNLVISLGFPFFYADKSQPVKRNLGTSEHPILVDNPLYNINNRPFNAVATLSHGEIQGIDAKSIQPSGAAEYENHQFLSWPDYLGADTVTFPDPKRPGQVKTVPFGKLVIQLGEGPQRATLHHEICAEAWPGIYDNGTINQTEVEEGRYLSRLAQTHDISLTINNSTSKPEPFINKPQLRATLCKVGSNITGGGYIYTNSLGLEAAPAAYEGGSIYATSGEVIHRSERYSMADVVYSSATMELPVPQKGQAHVIIPHEFHVKAVDEKKGAPAAWEQATGHKREAEEVVRNTALWIRDYLKKTELQGLVISLSGGADSAFGAVMVSEAIDLNIHQLESQLGDKKAAVAAFINQFPHLKYREAVLAESEINGADAAIDLLKKNMLTCIYLPSDNSGVTTEDAARTLIEGGKLVTVDMGDGSTTTVVLNEANAILAGRDGIVLRGSNISAILGNLVGAGRNGVSLNNTNGSLIAGNGIAALQDGIVLNDADFTAVAANGIGAGRDGIRGRNNTGLIIAGNTINEAGRDGIALRNSNIALLANNTVKQAGRDGIRLNQSRDMLLTGNTVSNTQRGFNLINGTDNVTLTNNTANNNGIGVNLRDASDIALNGNSITNNDVGVSGLRVSNLTATGNNIGTNLTGLSLTDTTNVNLTNNSITNNDVGVSGLRVSNLSANGNNIGTNLTGLSLTDTTNVTLTNNSITNNDVGIDLLGIAGLTATGNTISANDIGVQGADSENLTFAGNTISTNLVGLGLTGVSNVLLEGNLISGNGTGLDADGIIGLSVLGNSFTENTTGASVANTDNATFSGNIFTGNVLGILLDNSSDTQLTGETITTPAGGVGIRIANGSGNTQVAGLTISGGTGIEIDGAGSSMQFADDTSEFSNMDFYFVLTNGAMVGETLDASQQFFEGIRASEFTFAQFLEAEAKTIDIADSLDVGDVFYRTFDFLTALDETELNRRNLYRRGLFSYAGRSQLSTNVEEKGFTLNPATLNLSLLSQNNQAPTTPAGIANLFANLAPAAGGTNPQALNNLNPAAGGNAGVPSAQSFANLQPSAGGSCGNSFLGGGYSVSFNIGSCQ